MTGPAPLKWPPYLRKPSHIPPPKTLIKPQQRKPRAPGNSRRQHIAVPTSICGSDIVGD
ncbi:hypothetical protein HanIR_Chr15g0784481 [Helianthus annuus]|nr:hypothetical protein HanIR_Chr15g0784481 [Helianthus annuus]